MQIDIDLDKLKAEHQEISDKLMNPAAIAGSDLAKLGKRLNELDHLIQAGELRIKLSNQISENRELASSKDDPELAELAKAEIPELETKLDEVNAKLSEMLAPHDPNDDKNVIMEIRAGVGGDEASLFAGELLKMYLRYAENHGLKTEIITENANDAGGIKEVIIKVTGDEPYAKLKFESGVHRVQRIPVTESQGRVHTSTATVAVLPEATETDVQINPNDLRIDIYRASGHGGQGVNTTDSPTYRPSSH